MRAKHLK
jgi:hypothetical protein